MKRIQRLPRRNPGYVTMIGALLLLTVIAIGLQTALSSSASNITDSSKMSDAAQALFVAESGMERAAARFMSGAVTCSGAAESNVTLATGQTFTIQGFTTDFSGGSQSSSRCRLRSTGTVTSSNVSRVVEAIVGPPATTKGTGKQSSFNCSVDVGSNVVALVGVSWNTNATITGVTINGASMTDSGVGMKTITSGSDTASVQIYKKALGNITSTQSYAVVISGLGASVKIVSGCVVFTGVDQTTPIDTTKSTFASNASGNAVAPSVTVTSAPAGSVVFDTLAVTNNGTPVTNPASDPNLATVWQDTFGQAGGAASYYGPLTSAGNVTMAWTWAQTHPWAEIALVVNAASVAGGSGSKVKSAGKARLFGWREVVS